MKKVYFILASTLVVAAVSCSKNEQPGEKTNQIDSFTLGMPKIQDGDGTKTEFTGANFNDLVWSDGDVISITTAESIPTSCNAVQRAEYVTHDAGSTTASFSLSSGSIPEGSTYILSYSENNGNLTGVSGFLKVKIPENQTYVENGIAKNTMPMYGYGTDLHNIQMKCLANVIRLNLYAEEGDVKVTKIELSTTNNVTGGICGPFAIAYKKRTNVTKTNCGMWDAAGNSGKAKCTLNCSPAVSLGTTSGAAKAFNIVISRNYSETTNDITATIYYVKGTDPTVYTRTKLLSSFTHEKRQELGKIYTFSAKDLSKSTTGYWD